MRVYRAIQFSARFDFSLHKDTFILCKDIVKTDEFKNVSKERIYEEYKKLFLKSKKPSTGLYLANSIGIERIAEISLSQIDELVSHNLKDSDKLIVIFSILDKIFLQISEDKKLLKNVQSLQHFIVPKIFNHKLSKTDTFIENLIKKLNMLNNMPKPLYMGKDLIKMGYKPSEKFKSILDTLYKMQLSGEIC